MSELYKKVLITVVISIFLLVTIEIFFRFLVVQSDSFNFTLSSKLWFHKYWKPINSLGYRDIEHSSESLKGKKIIFVVGDSFVAGQGINNYKDRFSNILEEKLGKDWVVINIAQCGWSTENEYKASISYPYKPDIIILSYFINDIMPSWLRRFIRMRFLLIPSNKIVGRLVDNSYSFNYFYWRYIRYINGNQFYRIYREDIKNCFSNETIWQGQKNMLLNIINYAKKQNIGLIVMVMPIPSAIGLSKEFTSKVADFLKLNKVTVIDFSDIFLKRNPRKLTVNFNDDHLNVATNKEIAGLLVDYIYKVDDTKPSLRQ